MQNHTQQNLHVPSDFGRIAIVASRWNLAIVERLVSSAQLTLKEAGVPEKNIDLHWAPGAFELPQAAMILAKSKRYACIVPLGCLIQGETSHFDVLAHAVASGLDQVGRETGVPISFGVLTVQTKEQALARADKGTEAAQAALALALMKKEIV